MQIEILDGQRSIHGVVRPPVPRYPGAWELSRSKATTLAERQADRLWIGVIEYGTAFFMGKFKMFFFDPGSQSVQAFGTTSWTFDEQTIAASFLLRVTISADVQMAGGPFVADYLVQGRGQPTLSEAT